MSKLNTRPLLPMALVAGLALGGVVALPAGPAQAEVTYTALPQGQMEVVDVDSVETTGEGANGPAELVLDGDAATYWHTQWAGGVDPLPHHITVRIAPEPVQLGQVRLTPRQSSNGSGRVNEYELWTAAGDCASADYTLAATGSFPGDVASYAQERTITLDAPVAANCAKLVYLSSWGGRSADSPISPPETVASLAEFNADVASDDGSSEPPASGPLLPEVPEGVVEIADGDFRVRLHPEFPQVVDYRLGEDQLVGRLGGPLTSVLVNEVQQAVTVAAPVVDGATATYAITLPGLPGVSFDVVATVADDTLRLEFANLVDPGSDVNRIRIPRHDLVTVWSGDPASQLTAGLMTVNRGTDGDRFENIAATPAGEVQGSWLVLANNSQLAAAFDTNAVEDNTGAASTKGRVGTDNNRWQRQVFASDNARYGSVWSGTWTWLSEAVEAHDGAIGREDNPFVEVRVTADANADELVDWQDAGIAARAITEFPNGSDEVADEVISRIPFNIVSQATHPFLRTLDDTKRISLATDNLGQKALLKGYQAEGHDSAHPDYAGHYNERAGGLEDLNTLAEASVDFNTSYGVHVNATESYSEAHEFSEELLQMPPRKAWGWMNQSYYIDGPKDLATGRVLERFQEFWDERPENLNWLYLDVYYPNGWEAQRLGRGLAEQGWVIGSEWSDKLADQSVWSHWSQDENYGGASNKGINSDVIRFVHNSKRDTWNPHPILSNSNIVDFEGWTGHVDYDEFIANVWERNLPVKFLQRSDIVKWTDNEITFANGTVAASDVESVSGSQIPTDRTIDFDGATVYADGAYLLPWTDGGEPRLYHYNIGGGSTTWELTDAWASQTSLTLFELTDTGRVEVGTVTPTDGAITLDATDGVAYVLYPTSEAPDPVVPDWGQASGIADPGFFSGTLDAYDTDGEVTVVRTDRGNFQAEFGPEAASLGQQLDLPAGTYSAWAWIEIEEGKQRPVTVGVNGRSVTAAGYAEGKGKGNRVANRITASTVPNATASDEKRDTGFQRLRVTFTTTGGPVVLNVSAEAGEAKVSVDDLRVVAYVPATDDEPTAGTIFFEDFENIDTGYFPFVTGAGNRGGDARTQLAEVHEPYSQRGWWGVALNGSVVEGGKLNDNVLDGRWSLMANNENTGEILKTAPGVIPFKAGRQYRVSFDHQTTYADQHRVRLGHDVVTEGGNVTVDAVTDVLGEQRETATYSAEFSASSCGVPFIAIDKLTGPNTQHNLTIDNLRVEDLGAAESGACLAGGIEAPRSVEAGGDITVTTTVSSYNEQTTGVTHALQLPEGWTAEVTTAGAATLAFGETSTQVWTVAVPADAGDGAIVFTGSGTVDGRLAEVTSTAQVRVIPPLPAGEAYLSDMQHRIVGTPTNGWGPIEWDLANGEQGSGDGGPLRLDGVTYPKGIGAHAYSRVDFGLGGECTQFQAVVGVDDAQTRGSIQFAVYGDGNLIHQTGVLRGSDPSVELDLDISGVQTLSLRVTDGGDGVGNDHGDWALARVTCGA
ncbi:endo-alpha-N-acetylgalactosaminidase family protein [Tessaracoccus sp. OS52]|uniref:endo-alpha-N-acetylgalactosaminidase family protein n=1 Tax=Tessaracoccus sp. OS52 TaxID=2886691 RepID=UPI001D104FC7|nr:endo-alpha-N-acetylgalactosaminidase family protein [Tessaracoccus sp. OS52]MCC2594479.1 endo-alpha-N-acetylgalactosaminidase family protein [Tessaracoccus sp. OS52]